jgi:hypothetical protein
MFFGFRPLSHGFFFAACAAERVRKDVPVRVDAV